MNSCSVILFYLGQKTFQNYFSSSKSSLASGKRKKVDPKKIFFQKTIRKKIPFVFEFAPFWLNKDWLKKISILFKYYNFFHDLKTN